MSSHVVKFLSIVPNSLALYFIICARAYTPIHGLVHIISKGACPEVISIISSAGVWF